MRINGSHFDKHEDFNAYVSILQDKELCEILDRKLGEYDLSGLPESLDAIYAISEIMRAHHTAGVREYFKDREAEPNAYFFGAVALLGLGSINYTLLGFHYAELRKKQWNTDAPPCDTCGGGIFNPNAEHIKCPDCGGTGRRER